MTNKKKAALGLKAKPAQVADLRFSNGHNDNLSHFKERTPKVNSITIKKNGDYNALPF